MGKDKNGGFNPPKGKPSGTEKEIADKYTIDGSDGIAEGIHLRHVNRNLHKGEDTGADNNS